MENKLKNGLYLVEQDFRDDLALIWQNALTFNDASTDVHKMALVMQEETERLLNLPNDKLFQKREKSSKDFSKGKKATLDKPLNF